MYVYVKQFLKKQIINVAVSSTVVLAAVSVTYSTSLAVIVILIANNLMG